MKQGKLKKIISIVKSIIKGKDYSYIDDVLLEILKTMDAFYAKKQLSII